MLIIIKYLIVIKMVVQIYHYNIKLIKLIYLFHLNILKLMKITINLLIIMIFKI